MNDLLQFDPSKLSWIDLSEATIGSLPTPRSGHGMTSTLNNYIYIFGGQEFSGIIYSGDL